MRQYCSSPVSIISPEISVGLQMRENNYVKSLTTHDRIKLSGPLCSTTESGVIL